MAANQTLTFRVLSGCSNSVSILWEEMRWSVQVRRMNKEKTHYWVGRPLRQTEEAHTCWSLLGSRQYFCDSEGRSSETCSESEGTDEWGRRRFTKQVTAGVGLDFTYACIQSSHRAAGGEETGRQQRDRKTGVTAVCHCYCERDRKSVWDQSFVAFSNMQPNESILRCYRVTEDSLHLRFRAGLADLEVTSSHGSEGERWQKWFLLNHSHTCLVSRLSPGAQSSAPVRHNDTRGGKVTMEGWWIGKVLQKRLLHYL